MGTKVGRGLVWQQLFTWWTASTRSSERSRPLPRKPAEYGDSAANPLTPYFRNPRLPRRAE